MLQYMKQSINQKTSMAKSTSTSTSITPSSPSPLVSPPHHPISKSNLSELPTLSKSPSLYPGCCLTLSTSLLDFLHREIIHSSEYRDRKDKDGEDGGSEDTHSQNRASKATKQRSILSIGCGTGLLERYLQREFDGHVDGYDGSRLSDHDHDHDDGDGDGDGGEDEGGEEYDDGEDDGHGGEEYKKREETGTKGIIEKRGKRGKYTVEGVEVYTPIPSSVASSSSSPTPSSTITSTITIYLPPNKTHIVKGTWEICPRAFNEDVSVWIFVYPRQTGLVGGYIEMLGMFDAGGLRGKGGLRREGRRGEVEDWSEGLDGDEGWEDGEEEVKQTDDRSGGYMGGRYGEGGHEVVRHVEGTCETDTRETDPYGTGAGVRLIIWAGPKQDWTDYEDIFQGIRGWEVEVCQSEEVGVMEFECVAMIRRQSHQSLPRP